MEGNQSSDLRGNFFLDLKGLLRHVVSSIMKEVYVTMLSFDNLDKHSGCLLFSSLSHPTSLFFLQPFSGYFHLLDSSVSRRPFSS